MGTDRTHLAKLTGLTGPDRIDVATQSMIAGDVCYRAAERLLSARVLRLEETGVAIVVTRILHYITPAPAAIIHEKLGLPTHCAPFDANRRTD